MKDKQYLDIQAKAIWYVERYATSSENLRKYLVRKVRESHLSIGSAEIIDEIISEPIGGAHRDSDLTINNVKQSLLKNLNSLSKSKNSNLLSLRREKYLKYGSTLRVS